MTSSSLLFLLATVVGVLFITKGVKHIREDQRVIVERFGRFLSLRGPGWYIFNVFTDKCFIFNLEKIIPGWRGYTEDQLEKKLINDFYQNSRQNRDGDTFDT